MVFLFCYQIHVYSSLRSAGRLSCRIEFIQIYAGDRTILLNDDNGCRRTNIPPPIYTRPGHSVVHDSWGTSEFGVVTCETSDRSFPTVSCTPHGFLQSYSCQPRHSVMAIDEGWARRHTSETGSIGHDRMVQGRVWDV